MPVTPLSRVSAAALAVGGVANFFFLVLSGGEVTGARVMLTDRWIYTHNLHFVAAALMLFGTVWVYEHHARIFGTFGHLAFVLALLGTAFHFSRGVITAGLFPTLAARAPAIMSGSGPLFDPPLPILVLGVATFGIGWTLLGIALAGARTAPSWAGWMVAVGALLQTLPARPFGPVPWEVIDVGGGLMAVGLFTIGWSGWRTLSRTGSGGAEGGEGTGGASRRHEPLASVH